MEMLSHHYDEIYSHPGKPLKEHLKKVGEIAKSYAKTLPINFIDKKIFQDLMEFAGLYHDIGKATPFFQEYLREKDPDKQARLKNMDETRHSLISGVATYFAVEEYLKENKTGNEYTRFFPIASFLAVRRHHTNLHSALDDIKLDKEEVLKKQMENLFSDYLGFLPYWNCVYKKLIDLTWPLKKFAFIQVLKNDENCLLYIIQQLIYSVMY
jgi:CRISPR-associated endonuclease/helicase Cas3